MPSVLTRESWVSTAHGQIFAKRWNLATGQGSLAPIVLFHDSLGCVELWREFPAHLALATGRDVIAYDRLGFGRSDPNPHRLDGRFIADEALGAFHCLREQLEIEGFVAFGHSVGGGMAVACAATYPADCRALITESAQAFVEDRTIEGIRAAARVFEQPGQIDRLQKYHGDKAAWVLSAWIDTWLAPEFSGWNLHEDLRHVRCPVLAIHGDGDEFGSARHPERIVDLTAGHSAMVLLQQCGHVPHREKGEIVIDTITRWLTDSSA